MARARLSHTVDRLAAARAVTTMPEIAVELAALRSRAAAEARRLTPNPWMPDGESAIVEGPIEVGAGQVSTSYGSSDYAAHLVEFGSSKSAPRRPLHRAAQSLGLRVTDPR